MRDGVTQAWTAHVVRDQISWWARVYRPGQAVPCGGHPGAARPYWQGARLTRRGAWWAARRMTRKFARWDRRGWVE